MTMVNTVPPFHGGAGGATVAGALVSGSHTASVLPEVFAQAARAPDARAPRTTARETFFIMLDKLVLTRVIGKRNVCVVAANVDAIRAFNGIASAAAGDRGIDRRATADRSIAAMG